MYWLWERVCSVLLSKIATATSLARRCYHTGDWLSSSTEQPTLSVSVFHLIWRSRVRFPAAAKIIRINFVIRNSNLSSFGICQILLATSLSNFRQQKLFYQKLTLHSVLCVLFLFLTLFLQIANQTILDEADWASAGHRVDSYWSHGNYSCL